MSVRANLAPGQRYQWQMSGVLGVVSELIVTVVADSTPAGVRTNFMQVASWELLDGGGANIVGGSAIKEDYQVYVKQSRKAQSRALFLLRLAPTNDNVLCIEFGSSKDNYVPLRKHPVLGLGAIGPDDAQQLRGRVI